MDGAQGRAGRERRGPTPKSRTPSDLHVCQISDVAIRHPLHVEAELHHVAVLHHVVLALHAGLALGAGLGDRAGLDQVVEGDDLGLDEALLEVGVDDAGGLGGGGALLDGPGAGFLGAGREVGLQAEGVEADAGEGGQAGLLLAPTDCRSSSASSSSSSARSASSLALRKIASAGATRARCSSLKASSTSSSSSTLKT